MREMDKARHKKIADAFAMALDLGERRAPSIPVAEVKEARKAVHRQLDEFYGHGVVVSDLRRISKSWGLTPIGNLKTKAADFDVWAAIEELRGRVEALEKRAKRRRGDG